MKVYTIGFTKKSAEVFFGRLRDAGVKRIIDVRLNNVSQLAGFSKRDDLRYFAKAICGIEYVHLPELAPTQEIIDAYRKQKGPWDVFRRDFLDLMEERKIEEQFSPGVFDGGCLLCSEENPHECHRSLVVDYLKERWGALTVEHIP